MTFNNSCEPLKGKIISGQCGPCIPDAFTSKQGGLLLTPSLGHSVVQLSFKDVYTGPGYQCGYSPFTPCRRPVCWPVSVVCLTPGGFGFFDGTIGGILLLFNVMDLAIGTLVLLYHLTTYFFTLLPWQNFLNNSF